LEKCFLFFNVLQIISCTFNQPCQSVKHSLLHSCMILASHFLRQSKIMNLWLFDMEIL
jgi:hypothetical protein